MEELRVNDKIYILKEDVEKEYVSRAGFGSQLRFSVPDGNLVVDETNILGIGSVTLDGDWHRVSLSTEYLLRIIQALKAISFRGDGLDSLDIVWTNNYPCIIGKLSNNKKSVAGFILAPRITPD